MAHNPQKARSAPMTPDNTQQAPIRQNKGAKPPRLNAKTRKAIDLLVSTGQTQRWCAEQAGINEDAFSRALAKPQYKAYREEQEIIALQELKQITKRAQIAAINRGLDLMNNSASDAVRARMVELFAPETKARGPQTVVTVQNHGVTGYEMARPGQRIVDITPDQGEEPKQVTRNQRDDTDESQ